MATPRFSRRVFIRLTDGATVFVGTGARCPLPAASSSSDAMAKGGAFKLRYKFSTNLYGTLPIADIVPEVHATGCEGLDIWAGRWGNQREQIDALGHDKFAAMLNERAVGVATYTCLDPGFMKTEPHMRAMRRFGGDTIVAGFGGGGRKTRCFCENSSAISAKKFTITTRGQRGDGSGDVPPPPQKKQLPDVGPLDFTPMRAELQRASRRVLDGVSARRADRWRRQCVAGRPGKD